MIPLLDLNKDGKDVRIVLSKNLNFLLYIYRFYDFRSDNLSEYDGIQVADQGLMSTAFFHLRGITLWNNIIYALSDANQPAESDETNWYEDRYDFDALFSELGAYQAVREKFLAWWDETGEATLVTMENQIKDAFPSPIWKKIAFLFYRYTQPVHNHFLGEMNT
ncbi:MAG: hypothetical protein RR690_09640 [Longicatena sp.]